MYRTEKQLEDMAQKAMGTLPSDLRASELSFIISLMQKGVSIALRKRGE